MLTRYGGKRAVWIDLVSPTPAEVRQLMHEFGIDPLIAEELLVASYKSKVERRGDVIYVILHFPVLHGFGKRAEQEIDFVIGKDFLITARYNASDPLHAFAQAFEVNTVLGHAPTHIHGGHLFVSMARALYEALIGECHTVTRKLQDIEDRIFSGEERRMVIELSQTGRIIHDFREALAPHKEMLSSLEPAGSRIFGQEFSFYVRDLRGLGERVDRTIENLHGSLSELRETNNSLLTTKQNEIMKTLTVMAFIVLPLGLIADLFSINARNIEFSGLTPGFWILLATLSIVGAGLLLYFKRKEWL